jgi:8-oxo-dGTP pyrophosphatase MutT (NUDIX family)
MSDPAEPLPAATIILVREAPNLEVLMVRRHAGLAFGASAWVFPGGKVTAEDSEPGWSALLGAEPAPAQIAAVRETFEETGLLLARRADGSEPGLETSRDVAGLRAQVEADPGLFRRMLSERGLVPALDRIIPFAHWITPAFEKRRFDTRFFLAPAPDAQLAMHDGREAVEHVWVAPHKALAMRARGEAKLMFPTRLNLEVLAQAASVEEAEQLARRRPLVPVEPMVFERDGQRMLRIPAAAGYSVSEERIENVMG